MLVDLFKVAQEVCFWWNTIKPKGAFRTLSNIYDVDFISNIYVSQGSKYESEALLKNIPAPHIQVWTLILFYTFLHINQKISKVPC